MRRSTNGVERWLVVAHEATNSGAPRMLLEILKGVRARRGPSWECEFIFNHGGQLFDDFARLGPARRLAHDWAEGTEWPARVLRRLSRRLPYTTRQFAAWVADWQRRGGGIIYSNTGTNGRLLAALPPGSGRVVSHIHELAAGLRRFNRPDELAATLARTDRFLAVSTAVAADLQTLGVPARRVIRVPNFLTSLPAASVPEVARLAVCRRLGLPPATRLVTGCGHIDPVKGTDTFVEVAQAIARSMPVPPIFLWLGADRHWRFSRHVRKLAAQCTPPLVHLVGEVADPTEYFAASDAVLVTSRAESFSRVALEAGATGCPVLAFAAARGPADLLDAEALVAEPHAEAMSGALRELLLHPAAARRQGADLRERIAASFVAERWIDCILEAVEGPDRV